MEEFRCGQPDTAVSARDNDCLSLKLFHGISPKMNLSPMLKTAAMHRLCSTF
jgi:hypothetical protein